MSCYSLHDVHAAQVWHLTKTHAWCAGYAGADLQALCTGAVMAALRRSSPEVLLDPRLEEGIPLTAAPAAEAAACPPGGEEQPASSLQGPLYASSADADSRKAGPSDIKGGGDQQALQPPMAATGLAPGASLVHDGLQPSEQQISDEHPVPAGAASRHQSAPLDATTGPAGVQRDVGHPAQASSSQAVAIADAQDLTARAQGISAPSHPNADSAPVRDPVGRLPTEAASALEALEVRACDWRQALISAPEACARRGSMAAMSAAAAQALPARLGPALLPACASALQVCPESLEPS